jgi:hypothetical protein
MNLLRFGAAAFAALALALVPSRSWAYCRTITEPIPASVDQTATCYAPAGAIPLWWSSACVGYSIQQGASKQISLADAESHTQAAFQRWSDATCPGGGTPSVQAVDEGPVACDSVEYSQIGPNQHAIIFRDASWPYHNSYNTLALTTVTFDTDTGEIFDADMEINTSQNEIVATTPAPEGAYDFDSIVTHEAGHFLGLAHTPVDTAVMYAFYKPGSSKLTQDDVDGICAIYAPNGTRAADVDSGTAIVPTSVPEGACDPTPRHGYGSACGPLGDPPAVTKSYCTISGGAGAGRGGGGLALVLGAIAAGLAIRRRRGATLPSMKGLRALALGSLVILAAATGAGIGSEREAHASVSISVLFDELVRDSSAAAIVTPTEQQAVWENGRIMTYTHVHIDRSVAGAVSDGPWVRTMGGVVGKIGQLVEGEAVLTVGRPGLLFLQPVTEIGAGVYEVTARAQGQFPIVLDEQGTERFVRASGVGALVPTPRDRVVQISRNRAVSGLSAGAPLATDVLHKRPVGDGAREVASAWARIHGPQ